MMPLFQIFNGWFGVILFLALGMWSKRFKIALNAQAEEKKRMMEEKKKKMGGGEGDTDPLGSPEGLQHPADQAQQWPRPRRIFQWMSRRPRPLPAVRPPREQLEPRDQPLLPHLLLRTKPLLMLKKMLYLEPSLSLTCCCLLSQLKQIYIGSINWNNWIIKLDNYFLKYILE